MNLRLLSPILLVIVAATTFAAAPPKRPSIPAEPIAKKRDLVFSDDFDRTELTKEKGAEKDWAIVVSTFSVENGTLRGTQMRYAPGG